ncbi:MAG: penicillin-binding protein 2 [Elainellaceae cyanobacterium]
MLVIGLVILLLNLFRIQVLQASFLKEQAKAQQMIYLNPMVPRRPIVDRAGTVLAIDQPVYTLYAHPVLFQKSAYEIAEAVAPIVQQTPEDLITAFDQGESGIRIVDGLAEDIARQIISQQLDGLELVQEQQRLYPQQALFSDVVGYVNVDREGQSGVEYSLEKQLQQPIDGMALTRSGDGTIIPIELPGNFLQQKRDDLQLQLTVDSRLQRATRLALRQQMDRYSAKRGAVIVMDVQDGSILSLVSEPSYDPNEYYRATLEQLRNWVLTDLYEPGSTFKPINVAIALQSGSVHPEDSFFDEGAIEIGGWPIQNSDFEYTGGRGQLSVAEILQYSSNVGMVRLMQTLQPGVYYGWLERLQLDDKTGIDLPSEAAGQMKTYQQFTNALIEPATTAFGQGFSLTPIKLIQLQSMIANGGKMVIPHVVQGLVDANGAFAWQPDLAAPRRVISTETAQTVLEMMEQVVLEGTGKTAQIAGYRIAGKTGTAQKAGPDGGYTNARITSFVSLFPVESPRYAVLAVVDEPQGEDAYGSTVAAPIVKVVMEALVNIDQIPPSRAVDDEEAEENRRTLPGNYVPRRHRQTTGEEQQVEEPQLESEDTWVDEEAIAPDGEYRD